MFTLRQTAKRFPVTLCLRVHAFHDGVTVRHTAQIQIKWWHVTLTYPLTLTCCQWPRTQYKCSVQRYHTLTCNVCFTYILTSVVYTIVKHDHHDSLHESFMQKLYSRVTTFDTRPLHLYVTCHITFGDRDLSCIAQISLIVTRFAHMRTPAV